MSEQQAFWETGGIYRPSDHPVVELFARQRVGFLEQRGLLAGVHRLLDVGAGSGFSSAFYPDRVRVVACDYAAGMLAGNPARDRVRCSATELPFADGDFDAVSCWELLHHLDDPVGALREMWRVARRRLIVFEPNRINPGPLAARVTFFAPVSLLFFLTVMVMLGVVKGQSLHPMHYFFLSAAFFAYHLLLAYLVDHLQVHASFAIASAVSVLLVVSYLRAVAGPRFALLRAGVAQTVFLVAFSYAFFFEGFTGLTVTIGAILTLFVLMQMTARVDWNVSLLSSADQ